MENYYIIDDGKTKLLKFKKLDEFKDKVELAISLKTHNIGFRYEKNVDIRLKKYDNISESLKIDKSKIILAKESHTDNIAIITKNGVTSNNENISYLFGIELFKELKRENIDATLAKILYGKLQDIDGLMTNIKGGILASTFADCTPIFFYDPTNNVIANIHSGWVGTTKRIGQKAVDMLVNKMKCNPKNILCFIGPHIRKDHFLVNDDVKEIFENVFNDMCKKYDIIDETNLFNEKGRQYRIDTTLINILMLEERGILENNIFDCNLCTVCNKDMFHSRRAEGINFDTNTGIIYLK